jgi:hypothetical protein
MPSDDRDDTDEISAGLHEQAPPNALIEPGFIDLYSEPIGDPDGLDSEAGPEVDLEQTLCVLFGLPS